LTPDQKKAAIELSRRVIVCFLERHGQVWFSAGDLHMGDLCLSLAYRVRSGSDLEMHHVQHAVEAAARGEGDPSVY
jgi:hypothetical protein